MAAGAGVSIVAAPANTIGGTDAGAGNVIAGNEGDGVYIVGVNATDNRVLANLIGTNAAGADLGNRGSGVEIADGARNDVGTPDAAVPVNTIAYNGDDGVTVAGVASASTVVRNSIFDNGNVAGDLGIDLAANGVTPNDALDADGGSNALQNHPVIVSAGASVLWTFDGAAGREVRLDFYANDACDASGSGEAQTPLGSVVRDAPTTPEHAEGDAPIAAAAGQLVTMTATRTTPLGPLLSVLHETSELSPCVAAS